MIVRGTAKWASVFEPNEMSQKYQVDICNLDKDTIKQLKKVGLDVKTGEGNKEDQGSYITAKASKYAPRVLNNLGEVMDGSSLIGNGSKIKASITPYSWNFKGKTGVSAALNSLMVLKLIAYGGGDVLEPEGVGGDDSLFDSAGGDEEL
mgnify:CR=1 FL=1|jgi:hypothetical protein|tara:strand:- start:260 stop:706 length:447 start_codon:yes stop_codon:yes gene_type:complete